MNIRAGSLYKCNCGGVWEPINKDDALNQAYRLIAAWTDSCVFRRGEFCSMELSVGEVFLFDEGGEALASPKRLFFVEEIPS